MYIDFMDERLDYCGRIDWEDGFPVFIYPSTSLGFRFFGRKAVLTVENRRLYWDNYIGAVIDGVQRKWRLKPEGRTEIMVVNDEPGQEREHEVLFFKRQDACHEMKLCLLRLSKGSRLLKPLERHERRIEVYGDSVSAGEVSEAEDYAGKEDPEHQGEYSNSWYSFAWITARKLKARIHNISQGGIPLMSGSGYVGPDYPGMEDMWDKIRFRPELGPVKEWDFKSYIPQLVIVAVGQNDSYPDDFMRERPNGGKAALWKKRYKRFVENIRRKYPDAVILLMTTVMKHDRSLDDAIDEMCRRLSDNRIRHFSFRENGRKTPGHIRVPEAEEMADELADYIKDHVGLF